ncbi:MAG TPA: thioredoxin [archaeon]|nr:thioredoxin [archaeon]
MSDNELDKIRLRKVAELLRLQSIPEKIINVSTTDEFKKLLNDFPDKIIVIDFWAVWCAPCKMYAPVFKKAHEEFTSDFIFTKINSDENPSIAQYFGITSIPTTLFIKGKQVVHKFSGVVNYETLKHILEKLKS